MTIDAPAGVAVVDTAANRDQSSYVDWPAIIAGIVLASALRPMPWVRQPRP